MNNGQTVAGYDEYDQEGDFALKGLNNPMPEFDADGNQR